MKCRAVFSRKKNIKKSMSSAIILNGAFKAPWSNCRHGNVARMSLRLADVNVKRGILKERRIVDKCCNLIYAGS